MGVPEVVNLLKEFLDAANAGDLVRLEEERVKYDSDVREHSLARDKPQFDETKTKHVLFIHEWWPGLR